MGSVDRACFGLFEMMIFRFLHNPLPLSFKPMNPNESAVVVSFHLGVSVLLSVLLAKLHLVHIKLQSHVVDNLSSVILERHPAWPGWLADLWINNFCVISLSSHLPGSIPSLERKSA